MIPADLLDSLYETNCPVFINVIIKRIPSVKNSFRRIFVQHMHKYYKVKPEYDKVKPNVLIHKSILTI